MSHQLELLSPAGNMERLEMVLHYGADAVYLAGEEFGMRAAAGHFDSDLLPKAVQMAHDKNVDVHVTVNTIPHEGEVERLPGYLSFLQDSGVDALIVADLGVMALAKKYSPNVDLHVRINSVIKPYDISGLKILRYLFDRILIEIILFFIRCLYIDIRFLMSTVRIQKSTG